MKKLSMILVMVSLAPLSLLLAGAQVEDQSEAREEAKEVVHRAFTVARVYCMTYPSASQTVSILVESQPVRISVDCMTVNAYFERLKQ